MDLDRRDKYMCGFITSEEVLGYSEEERIRSKFVLDNYFFRNFDFNRDLRKWVKWNYGTDRRNQTDNKIKISKKTRNIDESA